MSVPGQHSEQNMQNSATCLRKLVIALARASQDSLLRDQSSGPLLEADVPPGKSSVRAEAWYSVARPLAVYLVLRDHHLGQVALN